VAQNCEIVLLRRVQAHAAEVRAHWGNRFSYLRRSPHSSHFNCFSQRTMSWILVEHGRALPLHDNPTRVSGREGYESVLQRGREIE
jgi:hypothetical protein